MNGNVSVISPPAWFRSFGHTYAYNGTGHFALFDPEQMIAFSASDMMKEIML